MAKGKGPSTKMIKEPARPTVANRSVKRATAPKRQKRAKIESSEYEGKTKPRKIKNTSNMPAADSNSVL